MVTNRPLCTTPGHSGVTAGLAPSPRHVSTPFFFLHCQPPEPTTASSSRRGVVMVTCWRVANRWWYVSGGCTDACFTVFYFYFLVLIVRPTLLPAREQEVGRIRQNEQHRNLVLDRSGIITEQWRHMTRLCEFLTHCVRWLSVPLPSPILTLSLLPLPIFNQHHPKPKRVIYASTLTDRPHCGALVVLSVIKGA